MVFLNTQVLRTWQGFTHAVFNCFNAGGHGLHRLIHVRFPVLHPAATLFKPPHYAKMRDFSPCDGIGFCPSGHAFIALIGEGIAGFLMRPHVLNGLPAPEAFQHAITAVKAAGKKIKFLYTIPNFHNPAGVTMSIERRAEILRIARAEDILILEDNPYGLLGFDAEPMRALRADEAEGVIYLGSFSKTLVPGLRLGYIASPAPLYGKLLQAKQAADLHTPIFNQRIVHEIVKDGFLKEHVPHVRARYALLRDAMQAALVRHLPAGCHYVVPKGGMFFWLTLPAGIDAMALLPEAVKRGVAFVPGSAFYAEGSQTNTLRLSFVTVDAERIERGVALIGALLRETLEAQKA